MVRLHRHRVDISDPDLAVEEWQGAVWPVWGYRVAMPDDPGWLAGPGDWAWAGGVFVDDPPAARPMVATLPRDGHPPATYRPAEHATALLSAVLRVDPASREAILGFVNGWGLLGVGMGLQQESANRLLHPSSEPSFDSVWATQRAIRTVREHFHWLVALTRREWTSPAIPSPPVGDGLMRTAREIVASPDQPSLTAESLRRAGYFGSSDPYISGFALRRTVLMLARSRWKNDPIPELNWRAFSVSLAGHLRTIHPIIRFDRFAGRPLPAWRVRLPIDVLWAAIWDRATRGGRLVRCSNCQDWFVRDRRNKEYCSATCANRATSRRWYENVGRKQRGHSRRSKTRGKR
jgi:hypothetical protein